MPSEDRSSLADIVSSLKATLQLQLEDAPPERPVYVIGEGFGALLAISLAVDCSELVSRLLLVNPATSFEGSPLALAGPLLARLPPFLYQAAPFALAPILADPLRLAGAAAGTPLLQLGDGGKLAQEVQDVVQELQQLATTLPPATLHWRLDLMAAHSKEAMAKLRAVEARSMVLVGGRDLVLPPTEQHIKDLRENLARGFVKVLEGRSHALLAEAGVDLVAEMREEGFYSERRAFTSPPAASRSRLNSYGYAGPVEIPSPQEARRAGEQWTGTIRNLSSPVFFSTLEDGRVVQGLEGIPLDRPLLVVGNHQVYAFDMYVLVEELIVQQGLLLRGLAHPGIFADASGDTSVDRQATALPFGLSNTFKTFGAVPVTPQNFFRLLQRKESVLLYPGGVREGFKRKGEAYRLFWPARSEFVRMAARHGATILPLATVGIDDGLEILLDSDEILRNPWLKDSAAKVAAAMPPPRVGVSETDEFDQTFVPPLIAPKVPERMYFMFRKPIRLGPEVGADKGAADEVYREVKGEVEGGLQWLLERREADPYRDFVKRMVYENLPGLGPRTAPTFEP